MAGFGPPGGFRPPAGAHLNALAQRKPMPGLPMGNMGAQPGGMPMATRPAPSGGFAGGVPGMGSSQPRPGSGGAPGGAPWWSMGGQDPGGMFLYGMPGAEHFMEIPGFGGSKRPAGMGGGFMGGMF